MSCTSTRCLYTFPIHFLFSSGFKNSLWIAGASEELDNSSKLSVIPLFSWKYLKSSLLVQLNSITNCLKGFTFVSEVISPIVVIPSSLHDLHFSSCFWMVMDGLFYRHVVFGTMISIPKICFIMLYWNPKNVYIYTAGIWGS